jgi:hypothetical protein
MSKLEELKKQKAAIEAQNGCCKKEERAEALASGKKLCKEFGFMVAMLKGSLTKVRGTMIFLSKSGHKESDEYNHFGRRCRL